MFIKFEQSPTCLGCSPFEMKLVAILTQKMAFKMMCHIGFHKDLLLHPPEDATYQRKKLHLAPKDR